MKIISTLLLLLITKCAFCCTCAVIGSFNSKDDLKGYELIALVKITGLPPLDPDTRLRKQGDVDLKVLELFKGVPVTSVKNFNFEACFIQPKTGEDWLLFRML